MTVPEDAPITFNLQARAAGRAEWLDLARSAEQAGFATLFVADHPGATTAPFVALAAAGAVTDRIALGTYVANAGAWEPMLLASEVASLDLLSGGRAVLGIGAGHTPSEWTDRGLAYPSAGARVDHMIALADATLDWLDRLPHPRPVQGRVPLLIGGNGPRVLAYAAARADVVGITGLGRTLADGHDHDVEWSVAQIDARIGFLRTVDRALAIDSLVQMVVVTDDRRATATALGTEHGLDPDQLLACPYALLGTPAEIAADIAEYRERWGITRYTVRADAIAAVAAIRRALVDAGVAVA